jgi:hypothetical protein
MAQVVGGEPVIGCGDSCPVPKKGEMNPRIQPVRQAAKPRVQKNVKKKLKFFFCFYELDKAVDITMSNIIVVFKEV